MTKTQEVDDFEQVIEKVVFDESELDEIKIAIKNFSKGTITPKQLKQKILLCRARIVRDVSNFLSFCIERVQNNSRTHGHQEIIDSNQTEFIVNKLQKELTDRNELLEIVAEKINELVLETKKDTGI